MQLYPIASQGNTIRLYPWLSVTSAVKSDYCFSSQGCTQLNVMEKKIDAFSSYSNRPSSLGLLCFHLPSSIFHLLSYVIYRPSEAVVPRPRERSDRSSIVLRSVVPRFFH